MSADVVDTIRKLLRLSKSPHPGEAETALAKALELSARHQVDIDSLDLDDDVRRLIQRAVHVGMRISNVRRFALGIVKLYFNVTPVVRYPHVVLVGTLQDVAVAEYVIGFLVSACATECRRWRAFAASRFTPARRRAFQTGWFYGVASKLGAARKEICATTGVDLVLASEERRRDAYIADEVGKVHIVKRRDERRHDASWVNQGYVRGREINIRPAVAAPQPAGLICAEASHAW